MKLHEMYQLLEELNTEIGLTEEDIEGTPDTPENGRVHNLLDDQLRRLDQQAGDVELMIENYDEAPTEAERVGISQSDFI